MAYKYPGKYITDYLTHRRSPIAGVGNHEDASMAKNTESGTHPEMDADVDQNLDDGGEAVDTDRSTIKFGGPGFYPDYKDKAPPNIAPTFPSDVNSLQNRNFGGYRPAHDRRNESASEMRREPRSHAERGGKRDD